MAAPDADASAGHRTRVPGTGRRRGPVQGYEGRSGADCREVDLPSKSASRSGWGLPTASPTPRSPGAWTESVRRPGAGHLTGVLRGEQGREPPGLLHLRRAGRWPHEGHGPGNVYPGVRREHFGWGVNYRNSGRFCCAGAGRLGTCRAARAVAGDAGLGVDFVVAADGVAADDLVATFVQDRNRGEPSGVSWAAARSLAASLSDSASAITAWRGIPAQGRHASSGFSPECQSDPSNPLKSTRWQPRISSAAHLLHHPPLTGPPHVFVRNP
jgi:hypothetical protein